MKGFIKRFSLAVIALIIALSLSVSAFAASTDKYNDGERGMLCVALSNEAKTYYNGNYTYDKVSVKNNTEILSSLQALMTNSHTHISKYEDCKDYSYVTDSSANNRQVVLLYTSILENEDSWGKDWNREHVWPKSLGGFGDSGAGADLHHIRPSDINVNSQRRNLKYGNVDNGTDVKSKPIDTNGATVVGGTKNSTYFEPLDNVKGDIARICLYVHVRYGNVHTECADITNIFQSVDVLLDWCELDPVDEWEMGRNDVVEDIQGNRNVFIDYPEYAWLLFGEPVPNDMSTPSGEAKTGDSTNDSDIPSGENPDQNEEGTVTPPEGSDGESDNNNQSGLENQDPTNNQNSSNQGSSTSNDETTECEHEFECWEQDEDGNLSRVCSKCDYVEELEQDYNKPEEKKSDYTDILYMVGVIGASIAIVALVGVLAYKLPTKKKK